MHSWTFSEIQRHKRRYLGLTPHDSNGWLPKYPGKLNPKLLTRQRPDAHGAMVNPSGLLLSVLSSVLLRTIPVGSNLDGISADANERLMTADENVDQQISGRISHEHPIRR